jgi:hypothetical protein
MSAEPVPVVTDEEVKSPAPWRSTSVTPEWLVESVASLGWTFEESTLGERDLTLADGAGAILPSPPIGMQGFPGVDSLPHLAYARVPVDSHFFSTSSGLWLYLEVSDVTETWGRQWADYIIAAGPAKQVPLGTGYAVRQGTVIDTGDRLIRATWGSETEPGLGADKAPPVAYEEQLLSLVPQGS